MTRFGIYESVKQAADKPGVVMPFYQKILLGGFAGCVGGFVGTPADMVNVRWMSSTRHCPVLYFLHFVAVMQPS